jgi:hypothetical protein
LANQTFLPPLDFTPRQERVLALLRLVGPGPAAFFRDALRLIRARESLETATHLAGHCFREIESALRNVLLPDGLPAEEAKKGQRNRDSHRRQVMAVLVTYGIDHADKVAAMWLRIADKDEDGLVRAAHRNALGAPRPFDDGFQSYCDDLERSCTSFWTGSKPTSPDTSRSSTILPQQRYRAAATSPSFSMPCRTTG